MAYTVCHAPLESLMRRRHRFVTTATMMELQTVMLSTPEEWHFDDVTQA